MTELIALAKLSVNRYRFLLTCMTSLIALGLLGTLFSMQTFGEEIGMQVGTYAIFFCLLPSGVSAIALFDYGLDHDLSQADTGCSDWLLRQPIRSWKIATIPIFFKTSSDQKLPNKSKKYSDLSIFLNVSIIISQPFLLFCGS